MYLDYIKGTDEIYVGVLYRYKTTQTASRVVLRTSWSSIWCVFWIRRSKLGGRLKIRTVKKTYQIWRFWEFGMDYLEVFQILPPNSLDKFGLLYVDVVYQIWRGVNPFTVGASYIIEIWRHKIKNTTPREYQIN